MPPASSDSIRVSLNPYFVFLKTWQKNILAIIDTIQNKEDKTSFTKMVNDYRDRLDTKKSHFAKSKIRNTGRVSLYTGNDADNWKNAKIGVIGSLQLSEGLFNTRSDKALLLLIKRDYIKSGIVKFLLFTKQDGHWRLSETAVLEIS